MVSFVNHGPILSKIYVKIDFALERGYILDRPYHGVYSGSQSGPVNILPSAILSSIFRHFLHQKNKVAVT